MEIQFKNWLRYKAPITWKFLIWLRNPVSPLPLGLWIINLFVQRFLRVNGNVPWMVNFTSRVIVAENIIIGKDVWISFAVSGGCYIQGINGIYIGDHTIFAPNVCIISANHDPQNIKSHTNKKSIYIGKQCWIGANAVILPGVVLGDHVIVGAGSVVTKSFPSKSIIGGVPARLIRTQT